MRFTFLRLSHGMLFSLPNQGKVFDITNYLPDHPGGDVIIVHDTLFSPLLHDTALPHS